MSLYDRIVPAEALSWGTLTQSWRSDFERAWAEVQRLLSNEVPAAFQAMRDLMAVDEAMADTKRIFPTPGPWLPWRWRR